MRDIFKSCLFCAGLAGQILVSNRTQIAVAFIMPAFISDETDCTVFCHSTSKYTIQYPEGKEMLTKRNETKQNKTTSISSLKPNYHHLHSSYSKHH
jgi:hypothetical protein